LGFDNEAVLVLLGKPSRSADDLIDKPGQIHRLGIEFELAGFDLREVQYLVDEPQFSISVLIRWRLGSN
jgi:hypothetical protein